MCFFPYSSKIKKVVEHLNVRTLPCEQQYLSWQNAEKECQSRGSHLEVLKEIKL